MVPLGLLKVRMFKKSELGRKCVKVATRSRTKPFSPLNLILSFSECKEGSNPIGPELGNGFVNVKGGCI